MRDRAIVGEYGIFVAKFYKYVLIDSFQGYAAVIDSSANCAALQFIAAYGNFQRQPVAVFLNFSQFKTSYSISPAIKVEKTQINANI